MNRLAALMALMMVACAARSEPPRAPPMLAVAAPEAVVVAAPEAVAAAAPSEAPSTRSESAKRSKNFIWRTAGWASIGVGSVAALVAMGTWGLSVEDKNNRDSGCDAQKVCSQAGLSANDQLRSADYWNLAAWVTAAVGLGVGTVLVLTHPPPASTDRGTSTATGGGTTTLSVSPVGLGLRSTF